MIDSPSARLSPYVLRETIDGVVTLTLNRGDRYNPLSRAMIDTLQDELDGIAGDAGVRAVVIAGSGRGFCAGHDLKELREHTERAWQDALFAACSRMMLTLTRMPQPVIARVHGAATAAGCQLVSMCDLAVAAATARFALPGIDVGIFCSTPAVGVVRNVGRKRAMEMLLTGDWIDAPTALAWGLVNRVVPVSELDATVACFTDIIRTRSSRVIALGKQAFYRQTDGGMEAAYAIAEEVMARNMVEPDAGEGIDAFIHKRPARWQT
jgi:enoyl-CoA hydratase/carnithine racemase